MCMSWTSAYSKRLLCWKWVCLWAWQEHIVTFTCPASAREFPLAELVNLKQALHIFQECWITWKKISARRILLLSGIHHFIHWYLHRAASIHLNPGILSWASIFFSSSLFPREQSACPLNRVAPNSRAGDSCQPSLCLQASTRSETRANTGMTQIQTTRKNRTCQFATFTVPLCWFQDVKSSSPSHPIVWCLEFSRTISELDALF